VTFGKKGDDITWGRGITITPGANLDLGRGLYVGDRATFEVSVAGKAKLRIAEDSWISHDCHILCCNSVDIGTHVLIGEFVSIRDTTHGYSDCTLAPKDQQDVLGWVQIEDGVWVGRGALILGKPQGVIIGTGAIVGANSVVTSSVPAFEIWGGVPARFIKNR
jgi:acetyltransferase-like isoleucine patch superfamily enzyme